MPDPAPRARRINRVLVKRVLTVDVIDREDKTEGVRFTVVKGGQVKAQRIFAYESPHQPDTSEWSACDEHAFTFNVADLEKAIEELKA